MLELLDISESDLKGFLFVNGDIVAHDYAYLRNKLESAIYDNWYEDVSETGDNYIPVPEDVPVISYFTIDQVFRRRNLEKAARTPAKVKWAAIQERCPGRFSPPPGPLNQPNAKSRQHSTSTTSSKDIL